MGKNQKALFSIKFKKTPPLIMFTEVLIDSLLMHNRVNINSLFEIYKLFVMPVHCSFSRLPLVANEKQLTIS